MSRKKKRKKRKPSRVKKSSTRNRSTSTRASFNVDNALRKAIRHHQSGRLQDAKRIYGKIIQIHPNHTVSLHLLGVVANQVGDNDLAIKLISRAIKNDPQNSAYYNSLGNAFQDQGDLDQAISCYQKTLRLDPDSIGAHYDMGVAFQDQGKLDEAISCFQKAVQLKPDLPGAYNNMGIAFQDQGKLDEAISCFKKALNLKVNYPEAYNNIGKAFQDQGKLDEAISCFQKAVQLKPDFAQAYNNWGIGFSDQDKLNEAISCFHKALELKPDYAEAHCNLGVALNDMRKYEEAMACYKQAIRLKPNYVFAIGSLANLLEQTNRVNDAWQTALEALRHDPRAPVALLVAAKCERRQGNYKDALSRLETTNPKSSDLSLQAAIQNEKAALYDRLSAYDKAFECFSQANALISQTWPARQINRTSYIDAISQVTSHFSNTQTRSLSPSEGIVKGLDPVFLVGFPRSGTTLLGQILAAHPNVETLEEKPVVDTMMKRLNVYSLRYPHDLAQMDFNVIEDLRNVYCSKVSEFLYCPHDSLLVDKLPLNIINIGLIHRVFPKSKIIFALRHPCDVCLSCFMQNFELNKAMVHFLDINDTARLYDLVMALWAVCVDRLSLNFHVIKYENLVTDFDREIRGLFDFLEMPWDPSVRDYASHAKSRGDILTPSYHQVSEEIYTRSIYRWRNYVEHLKPILAILKPHVERFGYDLTTEV